MIDYLVFIIYKSLNLLFRLCPKFILKFILNLLAGFVFLINKKHKKIAKLNLDLAFKDEKNDKEKNEIIKASYKSLIYNMYEFIDNQYASKEEIFSKAEMIGQKYVEDAIKDNRKIIFIASHFGAWELAVPYTALKYGTVAIVNRRMNNKFINKEYVKARDKNNIIMIEKREAAKGMIKALRNGYHVAVAVDQNTPAGIEISFFGNKTKATDSTSRLAVKFDALLIPVFGRINKLGEYVVEFKEPIDHQLLEYDNKIHKLTQMQADVIENEIRLYPKQWFWQHKRWKFYYSDSYDKL